MLYEIPTTSEYEDNIVAFWTTREPASAGARFAHDYRLRWTGGEPEELSAARNVNCCTGQGGLPGRPPRSIGRAAWWERVRQYVSVLVSAGSKQTKTHITQT